MIKQLGIFSAALVFSATAAADVRPAHYDDSTISQEETTGFLSGAAIGAAAGGPPGAIIGAAIGAFLGDGWVTRNDYAEMQQEWVAMQNQTESLQRQAAALSRERQLALDELEQLKNSPQLLPAFLDGGNDNTLFDNTAMSVHFRSGSSVIEEHYEEQLESLVNLARQLPTSALEITGYADRNGDASRNLALSQERTASVREFIGRLGMESSEITTVAYGETRPLHSSQSFETDFFDRRVIVRLIDTSKQMLTQGQ